MIRLRCRGVSPCSAVNERDLEVPSAPFKNGCVTLEFRMSDVALPASLGLSADPRQLGIALIELKVAS